MSESPESFDQSGVPEVVLALGLDGTDNLATLREQAQEIIDEVLNGSGPEGEQVRAKLRASVLRHPGRPDHALLEHLMRRNY